jgi:UDP-N-acetylmuramyl pentapeptide phosphotransferase/UDP-N-acetylglucosamine-1-phosphate transferase
MVTGIEPMIFRIIIAATIAFSLAAFLARRFCKPTSRLHLLDHPNERSLHTQPTPRTGGVAIFAGFVSAIPVWLFTVGDIDPVVWLITAALLIAALSFLDDRRGLPIAVRLPGHLIGAGLVVFGAGLVFPPLSVGMSIPGPAWLGYALSILFLVWMVNLYNFMDGIDGFAGGMTVIGFGTFAIFGLLGGNLLFTGLCLTIAAAAGGFLLFNFPPARIFMGDTGSAALGLLAGGLSLWGARDEIFPFWAALLVFSPFIVDASVTLLRRLFWGERIWQAHKSHYYQCLVQSGWGHRKTVLYEYALMLACGFSALFAQHLNPQGQVALILFWCLAYLLLMTGVRRLEKKTNS